VRYARFTLFAAGLRRRAASGPHWYLEGIGVDPAEQRGGLGSALLRPGLQSGLPCALLTSAEENLPFYERHGFAVVAESTLRGSGFPTWALSLHSRA